MVNLDDLGLYKHLLGELKRSFHDSSLSGMFSSSVRNVKLLEILVTKKKGKA